MTPQRLSASTHLRYIRRRDGWAVYHSLFGNLSLLDPPGKRFSKVLLARLGRDAQTESRHPQSEPSKL